MRSPSIIRTVLGILLLCLVTLPSAAQEKTFSVTVETKTSEHPYFQDGWSEGYVIDGTQGKELTLEKGSTYDFDMGSGVGTVHPFYISTDAIGAGAGEYTNGVTNSMAVEGETLTFTPPTDAPDSLWYQCGNHGKMGWRMALVVDSSRAVVDSDGRVSFSGTGVAVNFSGTSGSDTVTVDRFNSGPDGTDGISESNVSSYRFIIEAGSGLSFDANTEVRLDVSTLGGISDPTTVTIYKRSTPDSGSFTKLSTSYDSSTDELLTTTDSFSEFVLASDSEPLPVELTAFEAVQTGESTVEITWRTGSETNNAGFRVQRRVTGASGAQTREWKQVGRVDGSGTTSTTQSYRLVDTNLPYEADALTYRLAQVDTDGMIHFSDQITVDRRVTAVEFLPPSPNPAGGQATIRYALPKKQKVTVRLYDVLGRIVRTLVNEDEKGRHARVVNVSDLSPGVYFVRLKVGGEVYTERLTVVR